MNNTHGYKIAVSSILSAQRNRSDLERSLTRKN